MKKPITGILTVFIVAVLFSACKKDEGESQFNLRLTDAPAAYQEVNIDLVGAAVNFRDDSTGWINLPVRAGVYNLLQLQNGVDTLISSSPLPTGVIKELRLILGLNNSIKVSNVVYPLVIPSGSQSGLKIKISKRIAESIETLVVDFDAALSVHQTGNGNYQLRPVLRIK
jgi:hypothetical protein